MAYDEDLADRIREIVGMKGITEKRMFGGLAFLINGNMAVAASSKGGIMVRVNPSDSEKLIAKPHASRMVMRGKEMDSWLRVDSEGLKTKRQLETWVQLGMNYARSLQAK